MTVEPYQWLMANAERLGIHPDNVNAASVDLCLGGHIIERKPGRPDIHFHLAPGESFEFEPGAFYIAHSEEYTRCPDTHAWMLALKSTTGRKGLNHLHAGWGDSGFEGQVAFEFVAHLPVTFKRGERIVQLIYLRLTEPTDTPYGISGRYQGQTGAQLALPDGEKVIK